MGVFVGGASGAGEVSETANAAAVSVSPAVLSADPRVLSTRPAGAEHQSRGTLSPGPASAKYQGPVGVLGPVGC